MLSLDPPIAPRSRPWHARSNVFTRIYRAALSLRRAALSPAQGQANTQRDRDAQRQKPLVQAMWRAEEHVWGGGLRYKSFQTMNGNRPDGIRGRRQHRATKNRPGPPSGPPGASRARQRARARAHARRLAPSPRRGGGRAESCAAPAALKAAAQPGAAGARAYWLSDSKAEARAGAASSATALRFSSGMVVYSVELGEGRGRNH